MPKRIFRKKYVPKAKKAPKGRRRLQLGRVATAAVSAGTGQFMKRAANDAYDSIMGKVKTVSPKVARRNYNSRLSNTDNIFTARPIIIGKSRVPSFQERVAATVRPPLYFKRNYQFSAECGSGRKGFFTMNINTMDSNDLLADITTYKSAMTTDTLTGDTTISANGLNDNAQFYVESHREVIKMVNSSSNAVIGKIHLFQHKRDTDSSYDGAGINPVNLMMYYTANSTSSNVVPAGGITGFAFTNTTASSTGYATVFNMPGSSLNSAQTLCASTDTTLSPTSGFISERMNFWFKKLSTSDFSLKPGQQLNSSFILHLDNNKIYRELQKFVHLAKISYSIVVEFQAGIVGDSLTANLVSTGTGQLSVIRENQRVLGLENKLKRKIMLQTAQLTDIANAQQTTINPDTGVTDTGVDLDP